MATDAPPQLDLPLPHAHDNSQQPETTGDAPPKPPVKRSWRRKFRKMRIQFDNAMADSNRLIMDEWKAMGTARRLQYQNDQLLDALLDFNDQPRVPQRHRFDLRHISHADTALPSREAGPDHRLHHLRHALSTAAITPDEYARRADQLHAAHPIPTTLKSLASLEATVAHTTRAHLPPHPIDGLDLSENAPGYMSSAHEEENLLAADQTYDIPDFDLALHQGRLPRLPTAHPPLSDKDLTIRNPDSVYSWLRKNQPQVFLQDKDAPHHENMSEKSAPKPTNATSRKAKRESVMGGGTPGPRDHEDQDASLAPEAAKARRKTGGGGGGGNGGNGGDDDTAYRPKGGSSRPTKRKREDGDAAAKAAKKKIRASTGGPPAP